MALAGGVSIRVPVKAGHLYEEGGMESPDGHCRTFDSQAKGSMFGDGVGVVVLKRLSEAVADGDIIHAVIKGSAVNNDGSLKVSYTAPSIVGQSEVVSMALDAAGISPGSISYIEAHGTATELGDPIEVASLTRAYRTQTDQTGYCAIGSVKTNVGHLDRAAGVSGLIKTVLALKHKEIPASLHFQEPNPEIDFETSPFYVNTELSPWQTMVLLVALASTRSAWVVPMPMLCWKSSPEPVVSGPSRPWQLLLLSARTESALDNMSARLCEHLQQHEDEKLADVAYTLQTGRRRFEHRRMLLCRDRNEAIHALQNGIPMSDWRGGNTFEQRIDRPVAFMFPGLGEQYAGMAQELYHQEATFRFIIDHCHTFLNARFGLDLSGILYPQTGVASHPSHDLAGPDRTTPNLRALLGRTVQPGSTQHEQVKQTTIAQPMVFVIEYALAQLS